MNQNRSNGPLIEIIISVGVFAFAGVVIVGLFLSSHFLGVLNHDITMATLEAQSVLEDITKTVTINGQGEIDGLVTSILYDENWKAGATATYEMTIDHQIETGKTGDLIHFTVSVKKLSPYPFLNPSRADLFTLSGAKFCDRS